MPSLAKFHAAASRAQESGGGVKLDAKGQFTTEGVSRFSRAVLWLKRNFTPGKMRRQNHDVLNALHLALQRKTGFKGIRAELESAMAGAKNNPSTIARVLNERANLLENLGGSSKQQAEESVLDANIRRPARARAEKFFDQYAGAPPSGQKQFSHNYNIGRSWESEGVSFLRGQGAEESQFRSLLTGSKGDFAGFVGHLATTPEAMKNQLPASRNGQPYKNGNNEFSAAFMESAARVVIGKAAAGRRPLVMPARNAHRQLDSWMAGQYDRYQAEMAKIPGKIAPRYAPQTTQ